VDVKKLARVPVGGGHKIHGPAATRRRKRLGYAYLHTAIDDHSPLASTQVLADESGASAAAFWRRAEAWFRARGVVVERGLTDNGFCSRGPLFNHALAQSRILHKYCRPYRPQTNGKVERFHRTLLEEWAYARPLLARSRPQSGACALAPRLQPSPGALRHRRSSRQPRHQPPAGPQLDAQSALLRSRSLRRFHPVPPHELALGFGRRPVGAGPQSGELLKVRVHGRRVKGEQPRLGRAHIGERMRDTTGHEYR
jgi:transposase InsO family protein